MPRRDDEPSAAMLRDMIIGIDQKHEDGHKRLREDIRSSELHLGTLENQIRKIESDMMAAHTSIRQLRAAPVDGMKLQFPIRVVVSVIAAVALAAVAVVVKIDSTQSSVELKITSTTTELGSKIDQTQKEQNAYMKRTDERLIDQQQSIQQLRNRFELLQNNVTDFMIQQGVKRGR